MIERDRLLNLLQTLSYERRPVTLACGIESDFYIDCKQTALHPEGAYLLGKLMYDECLNIEGLTHSSAVAAGGITLGADPLATAVSLASFRTLRMPLAAFIVRKDKKGHGTGAWIEGRKNLPDGSNVILLEDVITTGLSTLSAYDRCMEENLNPIGVVAIVDRGLGGIEVLKTKDMVVRTLFTAKDFTS